MGAGFALAFFITGAPVALHLISQPLAIFFCLIAAMIVIRFFEEHIPTVVLTAVIFQNLFVSLLSPNYTDIKAIEPAKSYNFITIVFLWAGVALGFMQQHERYSPLVRRMIYASVGTLTIIGLYFVAGLAINARSAVVYMRNIGLTILLFQLFLVTAAKRRIPLPSIAAVLLTLVIICGYVELFTVDGWLTMTNGWTYFTLDAATRLLDVKEIETNAREGVVVTSPLDYWTTNFLNTGAFDFKVTRLQGPNLHPISFGYMLAILMAFLLVDGNVFVGALAAPLLLATSAKGPLILLAASLAAYWLACRMGALRAVVALLVILTAYSVFVIVSGLAGGDYHVLGLFGGLKGFLKMPLGHTLGEGGNLSLSEFNVDWVKAQQEGATDLAVESAVGVLFFQLGVAAAVILAFYIWIARISWRLFAATGAPALALAGGAMMVHLVNGLFQEEAYFSPLSLALLMALVGLILGSADRETAKRILKVTGSQALRNLHCRAKGCDSRGPTGDSPKSDII